MTEPTRDHGQAPPPAPLERLRAAVMACAEQIAGALSPQGESAGAGSWPITLERPRRAQFGDYSTNAALLLAPALGMPPRELAERLGGAMQERLGASLERFEVAGPGFVNLFVSDAWLVDALAHALAAGERFGAGTASPPERVLVEFVSANPTGPMHVGHARNAAYGDALARMLSLHGHSVAREFYVNDAGSQVRKLGESIHALARGEPVPADGYKGEYVAELTARLPQAGASPRDEDTEPGALGRAAVTIALEGIRHSLAAFGVEGFDHWFLESSLHEGDPSPVAHTLAMLEQHGHTYRRDGALWLRTTDFGDDKDRVLVRSSGEHTYFASDIAYHQDKRERGFQRQIDVWGADHHGYVARMKAAYEALGGDPGELELLIMQLVHLISAGERAQMSKRAGEFVTLDELIAEIGVDAARWYLLARSHDTTVELDLDLARRQSSENDVYYVQYAHARIASVLDRAGPERVTEALAAVLGEPAADERAALHASERALIEQLLAFPVELADAAQRRAPHRIAAYVLALAQTFTAFYRDCQVVGIDTGEADADGAAGAGAGAVDAPRSPAAVHPAAAHARESLRIALCVASARVIARCLGLLGVSAPERM
ncbi:MAG TPA: arginine--tRNA ligase [Solirubrobacteraceae bacterium]|nr:arginine--tRNA ligase [Solirubrobacteraceae bacterium]